MMDASMASKTPLHCPGCRGVFYAADGERWCPKCAKTVSTIAVELSALELRRLRALATVRACSEAEIIRQAVELLANQGR